jgi:hypothetical protein
VIPDLAEATRRRIETGVWIGGLRVVKIEAYDAAEGKGGIVFLRPDNSMTGLLAWEVDAEMLARFRIGTRIHMQAGAELFGDDLA